MCKCGFLFKFAARVWVTGWVGWDFLVSGWRYLGGDVIVGGVGGLLGVSGIPRVIPHELRHAAVSLVV
nr:MAG TPA: hypothetical protein [Caudoviricetes sp.]